MTNSSVEHKCPCIKYTKMHICVFYVPKTVDIPHMRCYTLPINLRNESIEARFIRVCLSQKERPFRQAERVRRRSACTGRMQVLVRRIRSAGLSQILVKRYQWSFGMLHSLVYPLFHGPLCRRSIFYPCRMGYHPE